jgi:hypothetical protein
MSEDGEMRSAFMKRLGFGFQFESWRGGDDGQTTDLDT